MSESDGPTRLTPGETEWQAKQPGGDEWNSVWPSATGSFDAARLRGFCARHSGARDRCARHEDRPRRPSVRVDVPHPVEERDNPVYLVIGEVEIRHQPAIPFLGIELRWVLEEGLDVGRSSLLRDLGEVGGEVRSLPHESVTVDAVLLVPNVFPFNDLGREVRVVGQLVNLPMRVHRHSEEQDTTQSGSDIEKRACLALVHPASSDADVAPVLNHDPSGVDDRAEHKGDHEYRERLGDTGGGWRRETWFGHVGASLDIAGPGRTASRRRATPGRADTIRTAIGYGQ
jgi:hypothetical protein